LAFIRLVKHRTWPAYVAAGVLGGLGVLSKYNFGYFIFALVAAALSLSEFRGAILHPRMLAGAAAFVLTPLPHFMWALRETRLLISESHKFKMQAHSLLTTAWAGITELIAAIVAYIAAPTLVFCVLFWRPKRLQVMAIPHIVWLFRTAIIGLVLCLLTIIYFHVTVVHERWLQPLLFITPVVLAGCFASWMRGNRLRCLYGVASVAALSVLIAVTATALGAGLLNRPHNLNFPFADLAAQVRQAGFTDGTIIAQNKWIGGNLKRLFPNSTVLIAELSYFPTRSGRPFLLAWHARENDNAPHELIRLGQRLYGRPILREPSHLAEAPDLRQRQEIRKLGFIILPPPEPQPMQAR
jgi:4-amino-4-deoxy-L-arabinose transferase-like glycosyltransferase